MHAKVKQQYNDGNFLPLSDELLVKLGPRINVHKMINPYFFKSLEMRLRCPKEKRR